MNFSYQKDITCKRVKERSVKEAYYLVQIWRNYYLKGIPDEFGNLRKATLQQAADAAKVPKKTLEDYTQIFKKVKMIANLDDFANKKMGVLRTFMRKNRSKIRKALIQEREKRLSKKVDRQNYSEDEFNSNEQTQNQCKLEEEQYKIEEYNMKIEDIKEEEMKVEDDSQQLTPDQNSCCIFFPNQLINKNYEQC